MDRQEELGREQETDLWMHKNHSNQDHVKIPKPHDATPEPEIPDHSKSHTDGIRVKLISL